MADIRIKDLATTASSAASDDFMALDGTTNGTRKMSAANPSVTTLTTSGVITPGGSVHGANGSFTNPSFAFNSDQNTGLYRIGADNIGVAANGAKVLDIATTGLTVTGALGATSLTSPAASPLTLGTGTSGAAITVLSANNFVGIGTTSPSTLLHLKSTGNLEQIMERAAGTNYAVLSYNTTAGASWGIGVRTSSATPADSFSIYSSTLGANAVTVLNNGGVTIAGTTAGSSGAGALVVTGGISAGNTGAASYFGGNVALGATPSAWGSPNIPALDIGAYGAIYSATGVIGVGTSANCYYNGTDWIYKSTQYATVYYHGGGNHVWLNSATGVGGNTVSFTQAMALGPTGTLSIAGAVAIGNTTAVSVAAPSTHKVSILIGGVQYYLLASNV